MVQVGIMDISKTPSIINDLKDIAKIINKKTKQVKGYYIPIEYENMIKKVLEEIEYQNFKKRNQSLIETKENEDETLLDGLDESY